MKNIFDIGLSDVKALMQAKGYQIFTDGRPNIIGIRNAANDTNDSYNDRCLVWWTDGGKEVVHFYTITTHPGFRFLENPIAGTNGTAILVPGQYLDCWVIRMHRGIQLALCQDAGEVKVYRDANKDDILNCNPATIEAGYFGIDLHHGSTFDADVVGPWSAGCQVWRYHEPHEVMIATFKALSQQHNFFKFSYTLFLQSDFN